MTAQTAKPAGRRFLETLRDLSAQQRKQGIFIGLLLLSAALRIHRLDQSFWYDEIVSVNLFFHAPWLDLFTKMLIPNHHPLYSMLAKLSVAAFGEAEWSARLPAFVFGSLTPPFLFLFGSRWYSERTGALAGFFMSVSMWPVWFSQDARGYSVMILLTLIATHEFLAINDGAGRRAYALYLLAGVAAMYSQLYAGAVLAAHFLCGAVLWRRPGFHKRGPVLMALSAAAIVISVGLYLPMVGSLLRFIAKEGMITTGRAVDPIFIARLLMSWSTGRGHPGLSILVVAPALAGTVVVFWRRRLVAGTWLLSLLIGLAVPLLFGFFVYERFFCYALPGYYLMVAAGLDWTAGLLQGRRRLLGTLPVVVASLVLVLGLVNYYRYGKQAFKPAAQWLRQNAPDYKVLAPGLAGNFFWYYYPAAVKPPEGKPLTPLMLDHCAVVLSHFWSIWDQNKEAIAENCRPAKIYPSSAYHEYDVVIYLCGPAKPGAP